jgi:putative methyltransferase (TIGR04325 family)
LAAHKTPRFVREFLPPVAFRAVGFLKTMRAGRFRFTGPYPTWENAAKQATGYDAGAILDHVREATRKVTHGEAAFERDSILFHEPEYPFPLLSVILRAAVERQGRVSVLDFGGSLGSVYHQCRPFLTGVVSLRWSVVEQPAFVEAGQQEFQTGELQFHRTINESVREDHPDVVLLSSVLQYLPDPDAIARQIADAGAQYLVIDRTPVRDRPDDLIVVQHVPASIYEASYPCRVFSRERLTGIFGPDYPCVSTFPSLRFEALEHALDARYEGLVFQARTSHHPLPRP